MPLRKRKSYYSSGFPDLSTSKEGLAPVSNAIPANGLKKADKNIQIPSGYHIGHLHKQGPMIHSNKDVAYTGGRKV